VAEIEQCLPLAGVSERLLVACEGVLQYIQTTKTPFAPSVVFALVGPRPVVRDSARTSVFEILAASSRSGSSLWGVTVRGGQQAHTGSSSDHP
jgi:hypothetical protein